jgi:hypothetical protein
MIITGKVRLKTLEESNKIHELLFSLGYKYQTETQEYPKTKPYGIAWFTVGDILLIRKTNIKDIFIQYSCNESKFDKLFE